MLYELRIYYTLPGKLPDLNKRFENHTTKLWEKHGIRPVGFWTTVIGSNNNALYYMIEWKDMAERERMWNQFQADPDWQKARADSEKNGPLLEHIESQFLAPTSYSKLK